MVSISLYNLPWVDKGTGTLPKTQKGKPRSPRVLSTGQGTRQVRPKWDQKPGPGLWLPGCQPSFLDSSAGPRLTCDGAVVIVPRDPGQSHAPLGQVGELQVPGSLWPSWQQREKIPRRPPELEPARPCAGLSPEHCPTDRTLTG